MVRPHHALSLIHISRLLPVQRIAELFQRLAQEQVSIRDLRNILEAIIEWSPKEKDTVMLTEYVRGALKRQISYMYSRGQNMLPAILMDPSVEETIRKAIRQTSAGAFLALDPDTSRRFIAAVGAAAGDYRKHVQMPVLLASMDIRRYAVSYTHLDVYKRQGSWRSGPVPAAAWRTSAAGSWWGPVHRTKQKTSRKN